MSYLENLKNTTNVETFDELDRNINIKDEDSMDLIFVLDKSGSMFDVVDDTIRGFNSLISRQKEENPDTLVTLVLFDTNYQVIYNRTPIKEVKKLTTETYYASGCTALLDAIGTTINKLENKTSPQVLFAITTDGYENSSREFRRKDIKKMIRNHDWEFIFMGADIDVFKEAHSIGIDAMHTAKFDKDEEGIAGHWRSLGIASRSISNEGRIKSDEWKKDLED